MKKREWVFVFVTCLVMFAMFLLLCSGCVKTTRVTLNAGGEPTEEVTTWEPLSVPVVYGGPVYVDGPYYPPRTVVVRERYRPVRIYYGPRYTRHAGPVYISHPPHHHRHR